MLEMMASDRAIPTFEKLAANRYRYLGNFIVSGYEYGLISDRYPNWRVFSFTLEPEGITALQLPNDTELGEFIGDIDAAAPPERIESIVARFKRSKAIVDRVKLDRDFRCQQCGSRSDWTTSKGVPYCEAHHVIPLGDDGFDCDENLAILCACCHREIHLSEDREAMQLALSHKLHLRA
jgi:hypothetical protein